MATRTGCADLPLHSGHVPHWLATRMASLGRVIVEAVVHHYGRDEFLRRLAHPFGSSPLAQSWEWIGIPQALQRA
jgi:hypothetical protein